MTNKSTFNSLLETGWRVPEASEHPFGGLTVKRLGDYQVLPLLGPQSRFGARYFQIFLQNESGAACDAPVITGLHNQGRYPANNWAEISRMTDRITFGFRDLALTESESEKILEGLLQLIVQLLPPGGHVMAEYDSQRQRDTARSLELRIPPIITPLGFLLFSAGLRAGFKDWYFAEGGSEGPRKLQAYKALNPENARAKAEEALEEVRRFLKERRHDGGDALLSAARNRADLVVTALQREH